MSSIWAIGALIVGIIVAVVGVGLRLINAGKDEQKAKDQETQIHDEQAVDQGVTQAIKNGDAVRNDAANGRLRESDGYKRPPSQ